MFDMIGLDFVSALALFIDVLIVVGYVHVIVAQ
jgi:hypothetical protein